MNWDRWGAKEWFFAVVIFFFYVQPGALPYLFGLWALWQIVKVVYYLTPTGKRVLRWRKEEEEALRRETEEKRRRASPRKPPTYQPLVPDLSEFLPSDESADP